MKDLLTNFNPNSVAQLNNNIFGLPFNEEESNLIILPVPWEVTVSYGRGTSKSLEQLYNSSMQVDLYDSEYIDTWKKGIFMKKINKKMLSLNKPLSLIVDKYINALQNNIDTKKNIALKKILDKINHECNLMNIWVYNESKKILNKNKKVILLGGDHSTPFGLYKSLSEKHNSFGILHLDAHCDLRNSYEDFTYSHASIMYNTLTNIPQISDLIQVGIRDFCHEELEFIKNNKKIKTFFDKDIQYQKLEGKTWSKIVNEIIKSLPQKIHISFDIDVLDSKYCPNTGTPVLGGLDIYEIFYLLQQIHKSKKEIIGIDLVEIGYNKLNDWNTNVGSRILYKLACFLNS